MNYHNAKSKYWFQIPSTNTDPRYKISVQNTIIIQISLVRTHYHYHRIMYPTTNCIALRHVYGIQLTNTIRVGWVLNKRSRVASASNFRSHAWSSFCSRDGWLARRGEGTRVCLTHPIQYQYHAIPFSYWTSVPSNIIQYHPIPFKTM